MEGPECASGRDYLQTQPLGELKVRYGPILLPAYDPTWPDRFALESDEVRRARGERALRIEHVGSTSVPGLVAKPLVSLLRVVADSGREGVRRRATGRGLHPAGRSSQSGRPSSLGQSETIISVLNQQPVPSAYVTTCRKYLRRCLTADLGPSCQEDVIGTLEVPPHRLGHRRKEFENDLAWFLESRLVVLVRSVATGKSQIRSSPIIVNVPKGSPSSQTSRPPASSAGVDRATTRCRFLVLRASTGRPRRQPRIPANRPNGSRQPIGSYRNPCQRAGHEVLIGAVRPSKRPVPRGRRFHRGHGADNSPLSRLAP
ncbi:MAG: GrpB family protein [Acidobacteria bacterium]|nr:GrpB family protein [Acidobacteriota bacterium]